MDCKITSRNNRRRAGFTLTEFVVASFIAIVLMVALMAFSLFSGRSLLAMSNYLDLDAQSRRALDSLTKEMRRAKAVAAYSTNSITFTDFDGAALTFTFSPTNRTFQRTKGSETTTLLENCDTLSFNMLERDPIENSFELTTATNVANCKSIWITWKCSRTFVAPAVNADNLTTANIVLRLK
jgi:hypothetical protein